MRRSTRWPRVSCSRRLALPACLCALCLSGWGVPAPGRAADVRFADRFDAVADGEIVVETGPGDTLVFDGGSFSAEGRPLLVIAETIRIDAPTVIISHGADSPAAPAAGVAATGRQGAAGGTWGCKPVKLGGGFLKNLTITICERPGEAGGPGAAGAPGPVGAAGGPIEFRAEAAVGSSLLLVLGNGETGGTGQKGGRGGPGGVGVRGDNRGGDMFCGSQGAQLDGSPGGGGGVGGKGGPGGAGGRGSEIVLSEALRSAVAELPPEEAYALFQAVTEGTIPPTLGFPVLAVSVGGRGGSGGPGGDPGAGAVGGGGGGGSHCGGGGVPGAPGAPGGAGSTGGLGGFGVAGSIRIE